MKLRKAFLIIALIIIADQALKIWIKTHYTFGNTGVTGLNWFQLYFIENKGMAWGWEFGGNWGKMILTLFRLGAVIFGNAETVSELGTNRFEVISPAVGIGLRIKFNKFSNTNTCIDFGVGTKGSHGFVGNLGEAF